MYTVEKGTLLIAEPFLQDINFQRSVILVCENDLEGTFGITLNKDTGDPLGYYLEDSDESFLPIYDGGPVGRDQLHFLHMIPDLIPGGLHITDGVYWGGDFETMTALVREKAIDENEIRFYLGYAGWEPQQLDEELKEKSWLCLPGQAELIFHKDLKCIWKDAVRNLGSDYLPMINYPLDPSFN
jgi:putative transcriptional regulator